MSRDFLKCDPANQREGELFVCHHHVVAFVYLYICIFCVFVYLPTKGRVSCLFVIIMSSYLCICLFFVFVYLPTKGRVGQFCCRHHCDHHNGHIISMMMIIILGETFLQVTRLLQGYIENEVKLHNCEHESPHHHCEHQSKIIIISGWHESNSEL